MTEKVRPVIIRETRPRTLTPCGIPSCGTHGQLRKENPMEAIYARNSMNSYKVGYVDTTI